MPVVAELLMDLEAEPAVREWVAPARRRSLPWLMLGVLLVAGCGLAFAVTSLRLSGRHPVLAIARSVPAGHVLTSGDLEVVNVAADSSLALIPGSSESSVLGQPVALPLVAGSLTTADVGTDRMPPAGWAVVGVALKAGQYPPEVAPGDRVIIVTTPGTGTTGGTAPTGTAPPTPATVVGVQAAPVDSSAATVARCRWPTRTPRWSLLLPPTVPSAS